MKVTSFTSYEKPRIVTDDVKHVMIQLENGNIIEIRGNQKGINFDVEFKNDTKM